MKWFLLLFIVGCLPRGGDNSRIKKINSADYQSRFQSFYYRYRFDYPGYNSNFVVIKIERDNDGKFTSLQTINRDGEMVVNSIPLSEMELAVGPIHRKGDPVSYRYRGDSYLGQGGFYLIDHRGEIDIPTANLEPPQITFTTYPLKDGRIVRGQGKAINKFSADDWQGLARARSLPRTFPEPRPLSTYLKNWFDREFAQLARLEHNRAITIDNNTYYGAVYQVYSDNGACRLQFWGFDDHNVVQFLYQLRDKVRLGKDNNYHLYCASGSDNHFELRCRDQLLVDQDGFKVVNNKLIISNQDGVVGYMDDRGICHAGRP